MQKLALYSLLFLLLFPGCSKDKYQTTPSLEIKSISPNPVSLNDPLTIDLNYTDKEGDIGDSIFVKKIRVNQKQLATVRDSFYLPFPDDVPNKTKGIIRLTLEYGTYVVSARDPGAAPNAIPDSLIFRIAIMDKGKHWSDTAESGIVVVERQ